jgi:uncharacterized membrane protein
MAPKQDPSSADLSHYRQERNIALQNEPKTITDDKPKDNIQFAIALYKKNEVPGPREKYKFTHIQDSKISTLSEIHYESPH